MSGLLRHLYLALIVVSSLLLTGCELDFLNSDGSGSDGSDSDSGDAVSQEQQQAADSGGGGSSSGESVYLTGGDAILVVRNSSTHSVWPSLEDRSLGGELTKLSHLEVGQTKSYTIPAGNHWLAVYSADSSM